MSDLNYEDSIQYRVVKNHEEQFSIWPVGRELPLGWESSGFDGSKQSCLEHIETVWTDMRPLSLRKQMEALKNEPPSKSKVVHSEPSGPRLIERLTEGEHDVRAVVRPEESLDALRDSIGRGFVQIEFTATQGGTTLGFPLDINQSDVSNLVEGKNLKGDIRLEGMLTLNFKKVRCIADINLLSLKGKGRLELLN